VSVASAICTLGPANSKCDQPLCGTRPEFDSHRGKRWATRLLCFNFRMLKQPSAAVYSSTRFVGITSRAKEVARTPSGFRRSRLAYNETNSEFLCEFVRNWSLGV
jgi:hypothetical protein